MSLTWNDRNLLGGVVGSLVPIPGLFSLILFMPVFLRAKITLFSTKLSFHMALYVLRHKANNICHSNKAANSLSSPLSFLPSASGQGYPSPMLINRWIKVHLEVESFIEKLITEPNYNYQSRHSHYLP